MTINLRRNLTPNWRRNRRDDLLLSQFELKQCKRRRVSRWARQSDRKAARRYRVFLNGREITNNTFYVDSRRGIARCYVKNAEGRRYLDALGKVATVEYRGHVKLIRRKEAR